MRFGIKTIDDFDVSSKVVLCRIDINQPVDRATGKLKSTARIEACVPTICELSEKGAKVVLMAHQGSDIEYKNFYTTKPHSVVLSEFLGKEVRFIEDVCGPLAREAISSMKDGDIILLDNVRFCSEEQTLFEMKLALSHEEQAKTQVVSKLAPLGDIYVCDAFAAAHRDQPTLCGFEQILPSAMGRLFEKEYCVISELMESPEHPCTYVLGGSKISDAFMMMGTVLQNHSADMILTGGLVGEILLASQNIEIGRGTLDFIIRSGYEEFIESGKELLNQYKDKIILPEDLARVVNGKRQEEFVGRIPVDFNALDIGSATAQKYREIIMNSKTVFSNGPLGVFEESETELGTKIIYNSMAESSAFTVVGGGDSVTAVNKFGLKDKMGYICTGGGALIRFLTGAELPVVKALRHGAKL